ncbi:MAG: hypothetical protein MI747_22350 [Desulfobacterales bacterium]|nr:hypothetical protein [Desulfobacterales bacterium]
MGRLFLGWVVGTMLLLGVCMSPVAAENGAGSPDQKATSNEMLDSQSSPSENMLESILDLKKNLNQRIAEKKRLQKNTRSETEKADLNGEIANLDAQLADANDDFERVATGVDVSLFAKGEEQAFDWKKELLSLAEPGIMELKRVTQKARKKAQMKDELAAYKRLLPVAREALANVRILQEQTQNETLKKQIQYLVTEWDGVTGQLENKLRFLELELDKMEAEEASILDASQASVKQFFKTRGLFIFIAVVACVLIVVLLRILYRNLVKWVPGYRQQYRPFHIRAMELVFRVLTVILALLALVMVFYVFEDWVLLSLTIIFILGLVWTAKNTLPQFVHQSRLILNIGAVREGERIWYKGVPWRVDRINMFSTLENPTMDLRIRVPIEELMGLASRECAENESFFPCRKNDWVILSDGIRGCVVSLSHEHVVLVQRGGARKNYLTPDFLALSPLNLSSGFRLKVAFGIGYCHQGGAVGPILEQLESHLQRRLSQEGYEGNLLNLRVEFNEAVASSLDLMVIADFKGEEAPLYNRIRRAIQRWCVEACNENGWEIPFPQMVIHTAGGEDIS